MYKYRILPARENSDVKIIVESIVGPTGGSGMFLQKATAKHERLVTLHIGSRHIQQSCSPVGELGVYRTDHYKKQKKKYQPPHCRYRLPLSLYQSASASSKV